MTEAAHQEFSVGDLVWYLIEFENYNLLVRCRITRKDDQFQKKDPAGILFYDIDEPLGHSADPDELGLNLEEWKEILSKEGFEPFPDCPESILENWRSKSVEFLARQHRVANEAVAEAVQIGL